MTQLTQTDDPAHDESLMRDIQRGDRSALAELYARHHTHLLRIGQHLLRSTEEAEDVLQAVFVEAWQRASRYRPDRGSVRTWLSIRMRSRCRDRRRSAQYARSDEFGQEHEAPIDYSSGRMPRALDARRATEALGDLPGEQRRVLELGYFKGLSMSEMADRLELPLGTVKTRVRAGLKRLRDSLHPAANSG